VGIVGGTIKNHPTAKAALDMLGVSSAQELGEIVAAVGLAQNLGALRALAVRSGGFCFGLEHFSRGEWISRAPLFLAFSNLWELFFAAFPGLLESLGIVLSGP
jgi:hypothetical protein